MDRTTALIELGFSPQLIRALEQHEAAVSEPLLPDPLFAEPQVIIGTTSEAVIANRPDVVSHMTHIIHSEKPRFV